MVSIKLFQYFCFSNKTLAEEIDVDTLEMMKTSHIRTLLSNYPLGVQIRFEYNLEQWRYKIGKPLRCNLNNDLGNIHARNCMENNAGMNAINLKQILTQCKPDGLELIDIYHRNQTFSASERNRLINIIINYYWDNKLSLSLHMSYNLENAILVMFPNERLDFYRTTVVGKIYRKYLQNTHMFTEDVIDNKAEENYDNIVVNYNGDQNLNQYDPDEDSRSTINANIDGGRLPNE